MSSAGAAVARSRVEQDVDVHDRSAFTQLTAYMLKHCSLGYPMIRNLMLSEMFLPLHHLNPQHLCVGASKHVSQPVLLLPAGSRLLVSYLLCLLPPEKCFCFLAF